jgi:hypothetical protein
MAHSIIRYPARGHETSILDERQKRAEMFRKLVEDGVGAVVVSRWASYSIKLARIR